MKHIVSFSGGKDSTAMLFKLLEDKKPIDDIIFFDTGWEFPEILSHVKKVQKKIKRKITVLRTKKSFYYYMVHHKIRAKYGNKRGTIHRIGHGWPSLSRRWCTRLKITTIDKYCRKKYGKNYYAYIGFAADEIKRTGCGNACEGENKYGVNRLYPLIYNYEMDESQCLEYCFSLGFDWGGLYKYFNRVSCFCCPLQSIKNLEVLRKNFPDLWSKMLMWEKEMKITGASRGFKNYKTLHSFDKRFEIESKQPTLF